MIRRLVVQSLWRSRACDLAVHARSGQGLMLRYHSVCADAQSRPDYISASISVPAKLFEQQVARLSRKYRVLTLDEVVDHMERRRPLPPRSVTLTFDDGYLDNYELALPILVKHRVPATIYLVSSTLTARKPVWTATLRYAFVSTKLMHATLPDAHGAETAWGLEDAGRRDRAIRHYTNVLNVLSLARRDEMLAELLDRLRIETAPDARAWFLSPAQVREMMRHGVAFGAHTVTHPNLPGIDRLEAEREITESKAALEAALGVRVVHFSYPNSGAIYPHVDDEIEAAVRRAGFRSAVTSVRGRLTEHANTFRINRIGVNRARSGPPEFSIWLERNRLFAPAPIQRATPDEA
jgi:peptidoglycan/xylan/chitin deacetylase (PgdA/CDA1 family)